MTRFPPPTTFAEGQRLAYGWLVAGAGMFCGAMAAAMVIIFVWGGWPKERYEQILTILGFGFGGFLGGMIVVMIALAVGGPVGRFRGGISKGGLEFEASGDEPPPQTVAAAAAGAVIGAAASKEGT